MNKIKYILVINGFPTSGKTTFEKIIEEQYPSEIFSSISPINELLLQIGWDGITKDDKYRNLACLLKDELTKFNDYSFNKVCEKIEEFKNNDKIFLMIDIREPSEIKKLVHKYPDIITVFISRDIDVSITNHADSNVTDYIYDYYIDNNGSIEELEDNIDIFINNLYLNISKNKDIILI